MRGAGEPPHWVTLGLVLGVVLIATSIVGDGLLGAYFWPDAISTILGLLGFLAFTAFGVLYLGYFTFDMLGELFGNDK